MKLIALIVVTIFSSISLADDPAAQAISRQLDDALSDYDRTVTKAAAALNSALDKKLEFAKRRGDLVLLKIVEAEQDAFSKTGELPTCVRTTSYSNTEKSANRRVVSAYKAAITEYLQADLTDDAKATEKEFKSFIEDGRRPTDLGPFAPGRKYQGFKFNPRVPDKKQQCVLQVVKAESENVSGTIAWHNNRKQETFRFEFSGKRKGDKIEFPISRDKLKLNFQGTAKGNSLVFTFTGVGFGGDKIDGRAELELARAKSGLTK